MFQRTGFPVFWRESQVPHNRHTKDTDEWMAILGRPEPALADNNLPMEVAKSNSTVGGMGVL